MAPATSGAQKDLGKGSYFFFAGIALIFEGTCRPPPACVGEGGERGRS